MPFHVGSPDVRYPGAATRVKKVSEKMVVTFRQARNVVRPVPAW